MSAALLCARLFLAAVFGLASLMKLADIRGSRAAVSGFGVPERLASPLGVLLPFAELAIAAALYSMRTAVSPTDGPALLLYAFEAVIIGGLGNMWGTLIGGVVLGVAQAVGAALSPTWQILAGHIAFLIILVLRPSGLFPRTRDL